MPQSYVCLHYHLVFSTKGRRPLITPDLQDRLYGYFGGILRNCGGVLLKAGGMPDHVHLSCTLGKQASVSDSLRDIKANSSGWIHETFPDKTGFTWQAGYGAFSISHSALDRVARYIERQEEHHRAMTYEQEFQTLVQRHGLDYDQRFIAE